MHLEHRISQRLLGRFLSQGFMYKDLSRACLAQTKGSLPLVYLIGRLCLYGHQATRLHEDVIAVCAEWIPPDARKGGLQPVDPKRLGEEEFMRRLDDALLAGDTSRITEIKRQELLASADRDIRELQVHLEKKANDLETTIRKELARAGEKEAENTRKLLEDQDKRIDKTLDDPRPRRGGRANQGHRNARPRRDRRFSTSADEPKPLYDERARRERAFEKRAMESARRTSNEKSWKSRTGFAADTPCRPRGSNLWGSSISGRRWAEVAFHKIGPNSLAISDLKPNRSLRRARLQ